MRMGCCCFKNRSEEARNGNIIINQQNPDFLLDRDDLAKNQMLSSLTDKYVLDTLAVIRTLVDNGQDPPLSMLKLQSIAYRETGWLIVIRSMVTVIPLDNPLGPAVIYLLLDDCPLPSKDVISHLSTFFDLSAEKASESWDNPCLYRNICVVLGCIAERLAGPSSIALLTQSTLQYLIALLGIDNHPNAILFALIALEKFAQTSENKTSIANRLKLEEKNPLQILEKEWVISSEYIKKQVGFCARWCLDNIFIPEDRTYSYEQVDNSDINAILNSNDVSEYLKLSPCGLQARCDAPSFESVRCTFQVDEGIWYYEATVITAGVMQIGWATKDSKFLNHEGYGIGDDEYSVAYDGCRQLIWHDAESTSHSHECWKPGDILGSLLNLKDYEIVFYLNGNPLPPLTEVFKHSRSGFFAAASFMTFQECEFNFGRTPFCCLPKIPNIQSFNDYARLDESEKVIMPRHLRLQKLRAMSVDEGACTLCFDLKASVSLMPCGHKGFCEKCSLMLEICPICRQLISERKESFG